MPVERSAGAIIYRKERGKIYYLLLYCGSSTRRSTEYWDFPKGHIEKGEIPETTVKREVEEETGLTDIKLIEGFKETIKYFFKVEDEAILKFVIFLLAETETKDITISSEHIGYRWLPFKEALEQLIYKNAKQILEKANNFIIKHD